MKKSQVIFVFLYLLILGISFSSTATESLSFTFTDFYDFLDQYEAAGPGDKLAIIDAYLSWQDSTAEGFPAIVNTTHVVFIYYDPSVTITSCQVCHDAISVEGLSECDTYFAEHDMIQLDTGASFFYHAFTLHPATRIGYSFCVNGKWINDPRNPYQCKVGYAAKGGYVSELAMPLFEREYYHIYQPGVPHGTVTSLTNYTADPSVRIYLPPNFNRTSVYPVVYYPDGQYYVDIMDTPIILDNLLADSLITPLIAVFSDSKEDRGSYYSNKKTYFGQLDPLVTYIDDHYPTIASRGGRLHVGLSLTGYMSAIVGLERSDMFRNIAIQSMAIYPEDIPETYSAADPSLDLNIWICCGTYETWGDDSNRSEETEKVAQFFQDKTWNVSLHLYPEGHIFPFWAHTMDELLIHFFPPSFVHSSSSNGTYSYYLLPVLAVLLIASLYRRKP